MEPTSTSASSLKHPLGILDRAFDNRFLFLLTACFCYLDCAVKLFFGINLLNLPFSSLNRTLGLGLVILLLLGFLYTLRGFGWIRRAYNCTFKSQGFSDKHSYILSDPTQIFITEVEQYALIKTDNLLYQQVNEMKEELVKSSQDKTLTLAAIILFLVDAFYPGSSVQSLNNYYFGSFWNLPLASLYLVVFCHTLSEALAPPDPENMYMYMPDHPLAKAKAERLARKW